MTLRIAGGFFQKGQGKWRDEGREGRGQTRLWLISAAFDSWTTPSTQDTEQRLHLSFSSRVRSQVVSNAKPRSGGRRPRLTSLTGLTREDLVWQFNKQDQEHTQGQQDGSVGKKHRPPNLRILVQVLKPA